MAEQAQTLAMAAALCGTLARLLDELDDAIVDEDARTSVRALAARLEDAIEERASE